MKTTDYFSILTKTFFFITMFLCLGTWIETTAAEHVCAEVITYGKNPQTGNWVIFPTPCDVPAGWEQSSTKPDNLGTTDTAVCQAATVYEAYTKCFYKGAGIEGDAPSIPNEYIVKFKPTQGRIGHNRATTGAVKEFPSINAQLLRAEAPIDTSTVEYVEPNYLMKMDTMPNDPEIQAPTFPGKLWELQKIEADKAWDPRTGSGNIIVALIDTGIDYTHPDLTTNLWKNSASMYGYNFVYENNDVMDDNSHGSHCAGIIAAVGNNETGIVGVNWSSQIMALKALDNNGTLKTSDAIRAIEYAIDNGAKIISASWGIDPKDQPNALYDIIKEAQQKGILFVASAGNLNRDTDKSPHYPSGYPLDNIISVAATDQEDNLATFTAPGSGSNWGLTTVHLGAPGKAIYSTVPPQTPLANGSSYLVKEGTSMAAPLVAGVAALVWSAKPELTYQEVRKIILDSVDPVPALAGKTVTGGRLNAYRAITTEVEKPGGGGDKRCLPVAICKPPIINGFSVTLDGTDSKDSCGGDITNYEWKVSNAEVSNQLGAKINLTFQKPGTYPITLAVTNDKNQRSEAKCDVTIEEPRGTRSCTWTICKQSYGSCLLEDYGTGCEVNRTFSAKGNYQIDFKVDGISPPPGKEDSFGIPPTVSSSQGTTPLPVRIDGNQAYGTSKVEITVLDLPPLVGEGGEGVDFSGKPVPTAKFRGGVSVKRGDYQAQVMQSPEDSVDVTGQITVAPTHVGQVADIFVYAEATIFGIPTPLYYMLQGDGKQLLSILGWDQQPANLVAFMPQVKLNAVQPLAMYRGPFPVGISALRVFFGYRLPDGTGVMNSNPIEVAIQ